MPHFHASSNAGNATRDLYNGNIKMMTTAIGKFMELGVTPLGSVYTYDQLNRLIDATYFNNIDTVENEWKTGGASLVDYNNHFTYDPNGNIKTQVRRGASSINIAMDSLDYSYYSNSNKLKRVDDDVLFGGNYSDDIDDQSGYSYNYRYDEIGNLIADTTEEIGNITWTVYGKIKKITRTPGSSKPNIEFEYTTDGQRSAKIVIPTTGLKNCTYYIRDAQGNIMGTYNRGYVDLGSGNYRDTFALNEWMMYGSSILGVNASNIKLVNREISATYSDGAFSEVSQTSITSYDLANDSFNLTKGNKQYQLSNHLGNVLVVVSDKRISYCQSDTISFYIADVLNATDYSPFGAPLPGRIYNAGNYRFAFNGKEHDDETYGSGNEYDYGFRIYNPRLGKFFSVDPMTKSYPELTPYQFASNTPICAIDLDGLEKWIVTFSRTKDDALITTVNYLFNDPAWNKDRGLPKDQRSVDPAHPEMGTDGVEYYNEDGTVDRLADFKPGSPEQAYMKTDVDIVKDGGTATLVKEDAGGQRLANGKGLYIGGRLITEEVALFNNKNNKMDIAKPALDRAIGRLMGNSSLEAIVIGHTDKDPMTPYISPIDPDGNNRLSLERTADVMKAIASAGVTNKVTAKGAGSSQANKTQKDPSDRKVTISTYTK